MDLLILVIALAFVRVWGIDNPLHKDSMIYKVIGSLQACLPSYQTDKALTDHNISWRALCDRRVFGLVSIVVISLVILFALCLIKSVSTWLLFPLLVALLIYSFGRGRFFDAAFKYTQSCYIEDWLSALTHAKELGVKTDAIFQKDWQTLHKHVFHKACIRGFDQIFVIVFYFLLIGPVFALFYRLLMLQVQRHPSDEASQFILMLLQWPAARLLSFSFALVGNFSGCMAQLQPSMKSLNEPAYVVLSQTALGAFNHATTSAITPRIQRQDIESFIQLYKRTLWLWFIVIALMAIVF